MKTKTNFPPEYPYNDKKNAYDDDDIPQIDLPQPKRGPLDVPEQLQVVKKSELK
ncbi:MAG: hypothetical protein U0L05_07560 [Schaedlerella sp.]|nr:hypothetical protein [Schaedlerella sp.]